MEPASKKASVLLGAPEQRVILLALCGATFVLAYAPIAYCLLDQGPVEAADRYRHAAHGDMDDTCYTCQVSSHADRKPALQIGREYMKEVTSGGINGLLMMVAAVTGGIGADISGRGIVAMGTASLAAYSFSMGFGAFMVESAKNEFAANQLEQEYLGVRERPADKRSRMIARYRQLGLSKDDSQGVADVLSRYPDFWVKHMMAEQLGLQLPRGFSAALSSGLATATSFFVVGAIPLLGVILSATLSRCCGPQWYRPEFATVVALALSATILVLLGGFLGRAVGSRAPLRNGLLMLGNGSITSMLAFGFSKGCSKLYQGCSAQATASAVLEASRQLSQHHLLAASPGTPAASASVDGAAWPTFRRHFFHGLCVLWVGLCTVLACVQLLERMSYESLRVFAYGWLTCVTTGLGAVPLMLAGTDAVSERLLAIANAVAGGMMLSASTGMLFEAHDHCGSKDWQIFAGLAAGALFILASERLHGKDSENEESVVALHKAFVERRHMRKAMLIFTVMFFHSAAEGIAVGVAFSSRLRAQFGLYVSLLLAIHNVPEGLAVALVLVPRGVSATLASVIAMLTSVPQPLLALAAFLFVDAFSWLLPLGLAFAAGAMIYVCLSELLQDAADQLGWLATLCVTAASFAFMSVLMSILQGLTGL